MATTPETATYLDCLNLKRNSERGCPTSVLQMLDVPPSILKKANVPPLLTMMPCTIFKLTLTLSYINVEISVLSYEFRSKVETGEKFLKTFVRKSITIARLASATSGLDRKKPKLG